VERRNVALATAARGACPRNRALGCRNVQLAPSHSCSNGPWIAGSRHARLHPPDAPRGACDTRVHAENQLGDHELCRRHPGRAGGPPDRRRLLWRDVAEVATAGRAARHGERQQDAAVTRPSCRPHFLRSRPHPNRVEGGHTAAVVIRQELPAVQTTACGRRGCRTTGRPDAGRVQEGRCPRGRPGARGGGGRGASGRRRRDRVVTRAARSRPVRRDRRR